MSSGFILLAISPYTGLESEKDKISVYELLDARGKESSSLYSILLKELKIFEKNLLKLSALFLIF